jgi:hypothetical protein
MAAEIPTKEPAELVVGDTWQWTKSLGDYPANAAPAWALTYYLRSAAGEISIAAVASGADHAVSVAKATTAAYKPGYYGWDAIVDNGTERHFVGHGALTVKPDPTKTGAGFDPRSHARKVLEAIEAVIEKRATKDQEEYSIGGRSLKRTPVEELMELKNFYKGEVMREDAAASIAQGESGGGKLLVRI